MPLKKVLILPLPFQVHVEMALQVQEGFLADNIMHINYK